MSYCGGVVAPPPFVLGQVQRFAPGAPRAFVQLVNAGALPGARATSWHRTPAMNRCAGGDRDSQHLVGMAVDVTGGDLGRMRDRMRSLGLRVADYGTHLHIQAWPPSVARRSGLLRAVGV